MRWRREHPQFADGGRMHVGMYQSRRKSGCGEKSLDTSTAFPAESFDAFLIWQIDHGHPHPVKGAQKNPGEISYLDKYDSLMKSANAFAH
ncbi:MAG: hypothetical protein V4754_02650 [Pseudomonadota bacterium]